MGTILALTEPSFEEGRTSSIQF